MTERLLADISKNGRERVRIRVSEYRGSRFADVRVFATGTDGSLVPTARGVSLRLDQLAATITALQEAERELAASPIKGHRSR